MRKLGAAVLVLAGLLVLGQWSGNQPERDSVAAASAELGVPFQGRFIDTGEVTLHVVFAGPDDGPPVVLLHGFPEFWYAWRGAGAVLAERGYRVVMPDQRGYNLSDKPPDVADYAMPKRVGDVLGLIDALGYERVAIGAQDHGAGVAWRLALAHPDRISRLAVIDVPHPRAGVDYQSEEETVSWYRTYIQIPWLPGYTARLGNWALLANSLRDSAASGAFPEDELDQFRSAWDRDGAIHTMGAWYRAPSWPATGDVRVATRTLVILAPDDAFIPSDLTRWSLEYLDDGALLELDSGSHWVSGEEPERIGGILADFFSAPLGEGS
jgi:pimeloyl-ACP methyl ester carboxylesterase